MGGYAAIIGILIILFTCPAVNSLLLLSSHHALVTLSSAQSHVVSSQHPWSSFDTGLREFYFGASSFLHTIIVFQAFKSISMFPSLSFSITIGSIQFHKYIKPPSHCSSTSI